MKFEQLVENRILEAIEAGVFEGLAGERAPLPRRDADRLAGDLWLAHHIFGNAGTLPEWLDLARTIERDRERLATIEGDHGALVERARKTGEWRRLAPLIAERRREFRRAARALRAKQDRYNMEAPSVANERPAIWVEERLRRLDARVREARGGGLRRRLSRAGRGWYRERSPSNGRQSRPKGGDPAAWPKLLSVRTSHSSLL